MITIKELDTIIPDIIRRLEDIRREATHYQRHVPKTYGFMEEIKEKILQLKKVHEVYKKPMYTNKDFTNYVNQLESYVKECREVCANLKALHDAHW